jgi:sugar lactone lactonase YvrE
VITFPSLPFSFDSAIVSTLKKSCLSGLLVALITVCGLSATAQVQLVPSGNVVSFPTTAVLSSATVQNVFVQITAAESIVSISVPASLGGFQEFALGAITGCVIGGSNASGTTCTVPITFTPAFPGLRQVPLQVVTSNGNVNFSLTGFGTGPQAAFVPGIVNTVAGNGYSDSNGNGTYSGDNGPAIRASLNLPQGVAVDALGNIYIVDWNNNVIRKVNSRGIITTIAGNGTLGFSGDGNAATSAQLHHPHGVAVDGAGNLYIADTVNYRIRKVDANGIITTVAGNGTHQYSGDNGPAISAGFGQPEGVAVDAVGNLYIADMGSGRVRKVDTSGTITTVAGNGQCTITDSYGNCFSGDGGQAVNAELYSPWGITVDAAGNIFFADYGNSRIRKVDTNGIITTVAGNGYLDSNGSGVYSGDGGPAISAGLPSPISVAVDAAGNLYIGDPVSERVRRVNKSGIISSVAGTGFTDANGNGSFNGDTGPATSAAFNGPGPLAVDGAGNIYIVDGGNQRIRTVNVSQSSIFYPIPTAIGSQDYADGPQAVTLYNTGNAGLTGVLPTSGTNPTLSSSFAFDAAGTCPVINPSTSTATLPPGQDCNYVLDFIPTILDTNFGTLVLTDNSQNIAGDTQTVSLYGTGKNMLSSSTSLSVDQTNIHPGQAVVLTAVVGNSGVTPTGTVTFSALSTGFNQGPLGTVGLTSGVATLPTLVPVGTDTISAIYSGDSNYSGSTSNTVMVINASVSGKLTLNWPYIAFPQSTSAGAAANWPVTLQNLTGVTVATPILSYSGAGASSFSITANTCTTSLPQGAVCSFNVTFSPTTSGSPSGTTIAATLTASTSTSANYSASIAVSGIATTSVLTFNWPFLNFTPAVPVGSVSSPWPITLTNQSSTPTTLAAPVVSFTDVSFAIVSPSDNCSGHMIAAGGSCTFSVTFSPAAAEVTQPGTNVLNGTMTASGNAGAITGTLPVSGWAAPGLVFNWPFVTFPAQIVGTTGNNPWPVTVTNLTGQNLTSIFYNMNAVQNYLGTSFTLNNTCSSLGVGASCTFNVLPSPISGEQAGPMQASLVVTGTTATSQSFNSPALSISSAVIQGGFSINWNQDQQDGVSTIDFGPQNTGGVTSGPWPITVFNNTSSTQFLSLSPNLGVFTVGQSTCNGVPAGGSCSFNLYFTPTGVQTYRGTLNIASGGYSYTFKTWGQAVTASYPVSGQIYLTNGCSSGHASGVTVSINTNPVQTTTTDSNGNFSFPLVPNGSYILTPSLPGASSVFYPATQAVTVNGSGVGASIGATIGYTVSGTVGYGGSKTGQVYVSLNSSNSCSGVTPGVSITSTGAFTIRGVQPGTYTLKAWMDTLGYGARNTSDPNGSTTNVTVSSANLTGVSVTIANPSGVTLSTAPGIQGISAFDSGVVIGYQPLVNGNSIENARSYTLQWSTDQTFSTVTGSKTFAATGTSGPGIWIVNGLTDGDILYFRLNGIAGGSTSPWSSAFGPVTIGAQTAANTISGTVSFTATPTGPLYVGFYDTSSGTIYTTSIASPVSPQAYTVQVPNGSSFYFFGILDQNNDGMIGPGDVSNTNGLNTMTVISGSSSTMNLTLPTANSTATLTTQHSRQTGQSDSYSLALDVQQGNKLPVDIALVSGPNVLSPADIGQCTSCGNDPYNFNLNLSGDRPTVGDTYSLLVTYSDGTSETLTPSVSAVLDAFATNLTPTTGTSTSTAPTFNWTDPSNSSNYAYRFSLSDSSGNQIWQIPSSNSNSNGFDNSITTVMYGTDPLGGSNTPTIGSLSTSTVYNWSVQTRDSNGNTAQTQVNYQP